MRKSVLVVDDDVNFASLVVDYLEAAGYRATAAHDAAQALIQAAAVSPAMIIMDVQMPSFGTGVDAVRRLREHPKLKDVPVLLMTAMTPAEVKTLITAPLPKTWLLFKLPRWQAVLAHVAQVIGPPENTKPPA